MKLLYRSSRNNLYVQFPEQTLPNRHCIDVACAVAESEPEIPLWSRTYDIVAAQNSDQFGVVQQGVSLLTRGQMAPSPRPELRTFQLGATALSMNCFLEATPGVLPFAGNGAPVVEAKIYEGEVLVFQSFMLGGSRVLQGVSLTNLDFTIRNPPSEFQFLHGVAYRLEFKELPQ